MKIKVTISTVNNFASEASYLQWKRAMLASRTLLDFQALEKSGHYGIKSGDSNDGSVTAYTFEAVK